MTMLMPMNVAPSGLPRWRSLACGESAVVSIVRCDGCDGGFWCFCGLESDVLRRKSWVIAMPMEAKEREVRSQARKVRSTSWY